MVLVLKDEVFCRCHTRHARKIQLVYLLLGVVAGLSRAQLHHVLLLPPRPPLQQDILRPFVDHSKISECVIACGNNSLYFPRLLFVLGVRNVSHLLLVVLHDLSLGAVLPRVVKFELFAQKVTLHLRQATYVLLRDVDLAGRKDVPSQTRFLD